MKKILLFAVALVISFTAQTQNNSFDFTISEQNLLFTAVEINGGTYTALIDFGDFATLQLSNRLIEQEGLKLTPSDIMMADAHGNEFALQQGTLPVLKVGNIEKAELAFYSAAGEIESVSKQVGTPFDLVLGAGFFNKDFILDFTQGKILFQPTEVFTKAFKEPVAALNLDYGYFIVDFEDAYTLLFDTGTPISQIDQTLVHSEWPAGKVSLQGYDFPVKVIDLDREQILHAEPMDITHIKPLGVAGIYGINDMKEKQFYFALTERQIFIK